VQAKRYGPGSSVGRPEVQAFVRSLVGLGATKGVFVTTSAFSQQAAEFVRHLAQRVILIDGQRLADLMIEHNVGVRVSRVVEFKRLDEDFFAEDECARTEKYTDTHSYRRKVLRLIKPAA